MTTTSTVTSPRVRLTTAPRGRLIEIEFTALSGVSARRLADEVMRDLRVARGAEPPGPGVRVETGPETGEGWLHPTIDVPVPQLPPYPTESDLTTYERELEVASQRQWDLGLARGRALLAEGDGASGFVSVRATGAGVLLDVTFRSGVAQTDPQTLRSEFLEALAEAVRAAGSA